MADAIPAALHARTRSLEGVPSVGAAGQRDGRCGVGRDGREGAGAGEDVGVAVASVVECLDGGGGRAPKTRECFGSDTPNL